MGTALIEFAVASTLLILAPGPDSMLVLRNALRGGRRAGLATAAGTVTGLLGWAIAAALGISTLLTASRVGYDVLRLLGAAYLIWLGSAALLRRGPKRGLANEGPSVPPAGDAHEVKAGPNANMGANMGANRGANRCVSKRRAYLNGVVSNVCNPKIGVFFVAFLPNVLPAGVPAREFSLLLGGWFAFETGLWLAAVVRLAEWAKRWLLRQRWQRRLEQITGLVLVGFGLKLATETRR